MTDERIVAYLLKELPDEELERFEDECFEQESWPAQLGAVEEELIDDYLREGLVPEQRRRFEQNYLTTAARRERVRMAAALLRLADERQTGDEEDEELEELEEDARVVEPPVAPVVPPPSVATWAERFRAFWGGNAWAPRLASVLVMAFVLGGAWWLYSSRTSEPRTIAALELNERNSARGPGGEQPGRVKLSPDTDALRVSLTLPEGMSTAPRYRVELENREGEKMPADVEGQEGRSVSVLIPAARLARGRYVLNLSAVGADGTSRRVGSYFFNVE